MERTENTTPMDQDEMTTPPQIASIIKVTALATKIMIRAKNKPKPHDLFKRVRKYNNQNNISIVKMLPKDISFKDLINIIQETFELEYHDNTNSYLQETNETSLLHKKICLCGKPNCRIQEQQDNNTLPRSNSNITTNSTSKSPNRKEPPPPNHEPNNDKTTINLETTIKTEYKLPENILTNTQNSENLTKNNMTHPVLSTPHNDKDQTVKPDNTSDIQTTQGLTNNETHTINKSRVSTVANNEFNDNIIKKISNGSRDNSPPKPFSKEDNKTKHNEPKSQITKTEIYKNYIKHFLPLQPNALTQEELNHQNHLRTNKIGGPFSPDFIHLEDKYILRCPICPNNNPINNRGSITSVKTHFRNLHKLDQGGYLISVEMILGQPKIKEIIIDNFPRDRKPKENKITNARAICNKSIHKNNNNENTTSNNSPGSNAGKKEFIIWDNIKYKPFRKIQNHRKIKTK